MSTKISNKDRALVFASFTNIEEPLQQLSSGPNLAKTLNKAIDSTVSETKKRLVQFLFTTKNPFKALINCLLIFLGKYDQLIRTRIILRIATSPVVKDERVKKVCRQYVEILAQKARDPMAKPLISPKVDAAKTVEAQEEEVDDYADFGRPLHPPIAVASPVAAEIRTVPAAAISPKIEDDSNAPRPAKDLPRPIPSDVQDVLKRHAEYLRSKSRV